MPTVQVRQNEPFDIILRRFRRACERAGVFSESRRRQSYEKPTTVRKRDNDAAVRREMKRVARQRTRTRRLY
ncbi:MAG: 30S ribosomal protein S21 [Gammaproteobacteria bacterium]|nr:30S ribosomal protein S21 [Gammaproteobacteria bacterium]MCY4218180.1 30S ribosomal protein S21 [Gammaproteobacteria bacterium]MCY4274194.1 30S ribosomal protein S21 [Gammaproteobacteria bacterium]